jgi:parallel beta-helix repeat protein
VSGSGTAGDPYVIGPWSINNVHGVAVSIDGTNLTSSFVLSNLTIAGNATATDKGIVLKNINLPGGTQIVARVAGAQTSIQTNNVGIIVDNSNYVTLDGGGANPNGPGVTLHDGSINRNIDGAIDLEHSSNITVRGWQLSANGGDHQPDWVTLDPSSWGVGGVRLFDVTGSTVDHNAANNDTDVSYSLLDSSNNTVSANTANYPFTNNILVADGSSYNHVTGNALSTGDFIGILLADPLPGTTTLAQFGASHDNVIQGNTDHSDGPTGTELSPISIVPAFNGGIVVLNGTYNNRITGNTVWSSAGGELVWAQAVPAGTTIGVATYPPIQHCNVSASEGGGGIGNLNGNVWTGNNVRQTIDPCIPAQ